MEALNQRSPESGECPPTGALPPHRPVRQSERGALYARALERLEAAEQLYPCFCSRADIRAAASAPHGDRAAGSYPGTCRSLSAAQRCRRIAGGDPFALRLRSDGERVSFADRLLGDVVRGADLADSTPRQIVLARLLGLPVLRYAHVSLVLGPDGARLAKRHRAATLADRGEAPTATLAVVAHSLGLALGCERVTEAADLLREFEPARLPTEPVVIG